MKVPATLLTFISASIVTAPELDRSTFSSFSVESPGSVSEHQA
jgi:hypothetical protein